MPRCLCVPSRGSSCCCRSSFQFACRFGSGIASQGPHENSLDQRNGRECAWIFLDPHVFGRSLAGAFSETLGYLSHRTSQMEDPRAIDSSPYGLAEEVEGQTQDATGTCPL